MNAVKAEGEGGFGAVAVGDQVSEAGAVFEAEGVNGVATRRVVSGPCESGFGAGWRVVVEGKGLFVGDGDAQAGEQFGGRGTVGGVEGVAPVDDGLEIGEEAIGVDVEDGLVVGGQGGGEPVEGGMGQWAGAVNKALDAGQEAQAEIEGIGVRQEERIGRGVFGRGRGVEGVAEVGQAAAQGGQPGAVEKGAARGDLFEQVGAQAADGIEGGQLVGLGGDEERAAKAIGADALQPGAQLGQLGGVQGRVGGGLQQPAEAIEAQSTGGGRAKGKRGEGEAAVGRVVADGQQVEEESGVGVGAKAKAPGVGSGGFPDGGRGGERVIAPTGEGLFGVVTVVVGDDGEAQAGGGSGPGGRGGSGEQFGPETSGGLVETEDGRRGKAQAGTVGEEQAGGDEPDEVQGKGGGALGRLGQGGGAQPGGEAAGVVVAQQGTAGRWDRVTIGDVGQAQGKRGGGWGTGEWGPGEAVGRGHGRTVAGGRRGRKRG